MFSHIKKLDWFLASYAILLVCFGLISLYSTSSTGGDLLVFKKQLAWLFLGTVLMVCISFLDYRILKNHKLPVLFLFIVSCLLLFGLFFFGTPIRGTISWYRLGPIAFEPVEIAKMSLIVVLAKYFSMRHIEMYRFRHILISGIYMAIPAVIVFLQSETGSVIVLGSIWLGIMVIAGIRLKHLAVLGLAGVLLMAVAWSFVFQDFQRDRIMTFINPEADPQGAG